MKVLICGILLMGRFATSQANNPYRDYLIARMASLQTGNQIFSQSAPTLSSIPKYQIPKGAIFCRMEDKVTRATGVWLKIGVQ